MFSLFSFLLGLSLLVVGLLLSWGGHPSFGGVLIVGATVSWLVALIRVDKPQQVYVEFEGPTTTPDFPDQREMRRLQERTVQHDALQLAAILKELQKSKYMAGCKCGHCHMIPMDILLRAESAARLLAQHYKAPV